MRMQAGKAGFRERPAPSPEVLRRLELSRLHAGQIRTREMHCPICGFLVQIIPVTQTEIVFAKCRKCKFTGPLDPAYFRRMKRLSAYEDILNEYRRGNKR